MTTTIKLFFYGTLKRGGYFFENYNLGNLAESIREARLEGYQLWQGAYPFVLHGGNLDYVVGEVHEYNPDMMELFDLIEGCPHLYIREELEVTYPDDTTEKVWVYKPADHEVTRNAELIEGGEFDVQS